MPKPNPRELEECIRNCHTCATACLHTVRHCLSMGGEHASPEHQTLLHDCAEICATAAAFMARGSSHHGVVCGACAELCAACADDCERLAEGDQTMTRCAEACRRCAESCDKMASAGV